MVNTTHAESFSDDYVTRFRMIRYVNSSLAHAACTGFQSTLIAARSIRNEDSFWGLRNPRQYKYGDVAGGAGDVHSLPVTYIRVEPGHSSRRVIHNSTNIYHRQSFVLLTHYRAMPRRAGGTADHGLAKQD
nr:hypothetical protein CFP56_54924 [Quercus suber]